MSNYSFSCVDFYIRLLLNFIVEIRLNIIHKKIGLLYYKNHASYYCDKQIQANLTNYIRQS